MSWLQCPTPCPRLEVELKKQKKRIEEESNYTFHPKINTRRSPKKDLVDRENLPIADRLYVDAMKRLIENKIREQMDIKPGDEELTFTPSFTTSLSSSGSSSRCVSRACSNDSSDVHTDAEISSWSSNSVSRSRSFSLSRSASMDDFEARTPPLAEVKKKSPSPRDNKVSLARMEKARRKAAGQLPLASVPGKLNFRTYSNDPQCPSEIRGIALASQESVDMGLSVDCDRGRLTFNYQPQIRTQSTPVVDRKIDNDDVNGDVTTLTSLTISEPEAEAASFTSTETLEALFGSVELDDASPDEIVTEVIVEKVEVRLRLESEDIEVQAVTEKDLDAEVEIEVEMNDIESESQTVFSAAVGEVSPATETSNALEDSVASFVGESTGTVDSGVVVTRAVGAAVVMSVKNDMPMVGVSEADADAALEQQGAPKKAYTLERSLRRSLSSTEVHAKANPFEGLRLHICSTSVNEHTPVTSAGSTPTYIQSHRGEMYHQPPYSHDTSHC